MALTEKTVLATNFFRAEVLGEGGSKGVTLPRADGIFDGILTPDPMETRADAGSAGRVIILPMKIA